MNGYDELWPGGPRFRQAAEGFRLSTDSVLLAAFAEGIRGKKIMDLGCGAGVLTVLLHVSHPDSCIDGVEIQPAAAALCRENLSVNGFGTGEIITGDLREYRSLFTAGAYDLVISNPPYFAEDSGYTAPEESRATARDERTCSLDALCAAAKYLCRWGGSFALVQRPERLSEVFCAMTRHGIEPKRLRAVQYRAGRAPSLVLVEGRRGGKPGLNIEAPLLLTDETGQDSEEIIRIYHRG